MIGTASGVYNAMRQVGGAFGVAIAATGALAGAGLRTRGAAADPVSAPQVIAEAATTRA